MKFKYSIGDIVMAFNAIEFTIGRIEDKFDFENGDIRYKIRRVRDHSFFSLRDVYCQDYNIFYEKELLGICPFVGASAIKEDPITHSLCLVPFNKKFFIRQKIRNSANCDAYTGITDKLIDAYKNIKNKIKIGKE